MSGLNKANYYLRKILEWKHYNNILYKYIIPMKRGASFPRYYLPYICNRKLFKSNSKYVVFRDSPESGDGILSYAKKVIFICEWANQRGYIPIIDIEHEYIFADNEYGIHNIWEYCFCNIKPIELVKGETNIYLNFLNAYEATEDMSIEINGNSSKSSICLRKKDWRQYYSKVKYYVNKWIIFNSEFDNYYNRKIRDIDIDNCIGVCLRESFSEDVVNRLPENDNRKQLHAKHPCSLSVAKVSKIINDKMNQWNCYNLFLSLEYEETLNYLIEEYGENIKYIDRSRGSINDYISLGSKHTQDIITESRNKDYLEYKEKYMSYVAEITALSRCRYLITESSSGAIMALSFNGGKYEDVCFIDDLNKIDRYQG